MIIAFDYDDPFFAKEIVVKNSDSSASASAATHARAYKSINPPAPGPWTAYIGSSVVAKDIKNPDALLVYRGQKNDILNPA